MKHFQLFLIGFLILLLAVGVALAQNTADDDEEKEIAFTLESEIGRALPRQLLYDPNFERMAVVDAYNRLSLVDALTYQTEHTLYNGGSYHDLAFSNDGRWLALAIDSRIELYDTSSGTLVADLVDLGQAIRIVGPLSFSQDDNLLLFNGIYPAPRSIRQSENDTVTVPWIWNLTAARNEGDSTFPQNREAWQFFDYRNGFVLGPEDRVVAALPGRLQVLDANTLEVLFEIPTARYEQDPLSVWFSAQDNQIYVQPVDGETLIQVDTQDGVLVEIPLQQWLTPNDLEQIGGIELGSIARVIGDANSTRQNELLSVFLGTNYRRQLNYVSLTATLVDLIIPPAATGENITALLFIFDEDNERGYFTIRRGGSIQQMVLGPQQDRLLIRREIDGEEYIVTYDLNTGAEVDRLIPALRDIGYYSRTRKNRVLAYDRSGEVIVSDFQRLDAATREVLAEDLRYSRRFERFFFTNDGSGVVTLSGTEWRLWDVATGEVLRREVVPLRGSVLATSADGFRYLTRYQESDGRVNVEVIDMGTNSRSSVAFANFAGRSVDRILPNADWSRFFVIYTANQWGQYFPGNEVAMYDLNDGLLWFMAGDDLPPADNRSYGWVDDATVFVYGEGERNSIPMRLYGLQYDASGLPACAVQAFPDRLEEWTDLWERLVYYLRPDALAFLTQLICDELPETADELSLLLRPTATPIPVTPTPIRIEGVPVCLTAKYPDQAEEYAEIWRSVTQGLNAQQIRETEALLCEGIGEIRLSAQSGEYIQLTMMIDATTGERASGAFTPIERISRPIQPVQDAFFDQEERALGQAILSPDSERVAASNLPGELVIYRLVKPYEQIVAPLTQTAVARITQQNLVAVMASPTPTYNVIGTPRPTLTPTVTPTNFPRPEERVQQAQFGEAIDLCPSETLFTMDNPPAGYSPDGRIVGPVSGEVLWRVNPATGQRLPDEVIPLCGAGINCQFSPDRSWILAEAPLQGIIYVIRPDGSDERVLFGEDDRKPPYINWTGAHTLEYEVTVTRIRNGREERVTALQRDILGVFPDPEPWIPEIGINQLPAWLISRQPGGPWALAYTTFSTGTGPGYKYYLYNTETGDYQYFARLPEDGAQLTARWHPLGDRLFYYYPPPPRQQPIWYQINMPERENYLLEDFTYGDWSNEGRYVAYRTNRRTQPIAVYDSQTGLTRTYCIPENGARLYEGDFTWSPDSRYLALLTYLPKDENTEGVGRHVLILDVETGEMVDLTTGFVDLVDWSRNPGEYVEAE